MSWLGGLLTRRRYRFLDSYVTWQTSNAPGSGAVWRSKTHLLASTPTTTPMAILTTPLRRQSAEEAWAAWRDEVAFSEKSVAEASDLDLAVDRQDSRGPLSLRWVLTHMIEEYARHNGHADFLRERIDGAVGQ